MTMHLAKGLSTISTKKPKPQKLTKAKRQKLEEDLRLLNKSLKQQGRHSERMTFDQYLDYVFGKSLKSVKNSQSKPLKSVEPYRRGSTAHIPSRDSGCGVAPKVENPKYTGTLVKGIATMHKSNAVPIIDEQQAKDIAAMRRN